MRMVLAQINATCGSGSTGKICVAVSQLLNEKNIENYILYTIGKSDYPQGIRHGEIYPKIQAFKSRVLGNYGFNSVRSTKKLLAQLDRIAPNVVHLHNLHAHNVHLGMLLDYLRKKNIKIFWTFHDCWTFTGYCPYYTIAQCDQWQSSCHACPQKRKYSWLFDRSRTLYQRKKELFSGLDLTIITPSHWLAGEVKKSFLKEYPVKVIHNGIDLSVFKPQESDFRKKYALEGKFVLLGVAFGWGERKGLDVFVELAKRLDDRFQIVLVGTNKKVDTQLPKNIISIHRTENQKELAEIYTTADLFLNPTREEVLGLVNLEALACGTPVVTFDTGGSPETIDPTCGKVVSCDDVEALYQAVMEIYQTKPFDEKACRERAKQFDANRKFKEYVDLYSLE